MLDPADVKFIENQFRSFEGEMRQGFAELHREIGEVKAEMTHMSNRLDRIGGAVNGGARAITKLVEWSERTDVTTADLLHRLADIDQRLRELEDKADT